MYKFAPLQKLMALNPVMQFSKKAAHPKPIPLMDLSSPTGVSIGLGQEITNNANRDHLESVNKQTLLFNMMKFEIQQRGESNGNS